MVVTLSAPLPLQMPVSVDWQAHLALGEVVLWQGRTDGGWFISLSQAARLLRTLVMIGLFLYILARLQKTIPPLWDVRMIVLVIFFQAVPSEMIRSVLRRKRSVYALTDRRALMLTDQRSFGLRAYEVALTHATPIETVISGPFTSIFFPTAPKRGWSLLREAPKQGFERLRDGPAALGFVRQIQSEVL